MISKAKWIPILMFSVSLLVGLTALSRPANAFIVEQVPEGYLVRLASGESVYDAWWAIWSERRQTNAPVGVRDIIELGEGVFPLIDQHGNSILHYGSGSSDPDAPPLLIRGLGASKSAVSCIGQSGSSACIVSLFGLTLEDLKILVAQDTPAPVLRTDQVELTLRRVEMVGQTLHLDTYSGAIDVFRGNLNIEESVLVGNNILGGRGLVQFGSNGPQAVARITRSVLGRNTAADLFRISAYNSASVVVEQSTLAENNVGVVFRGYYDESVSVNRSILNGNLSAAVQLSVTNSFTDADPELEDTGSDFMVPRPTSPVVDALTCDAAGFDQRGKPTGVRASYYESQGTDCDYGAIEAQHHFCIASDHGSVTCDEGEVAVSDLAPGCRLIGGLLDCTGSQEVEVTSLDPGESVFIGATELVMQLDGNLVLYENGIPTWATGTTACPCIGHHAVFEADGNFVLYSDPDEPSGAVACFATETAGQRAVLREGFRRGPAQFVVENADGGTGWVTPYQRIPAGQSFTLNGARFEPGDSLSIAGASAVMQGDGNFVLYDTIDDVLTPLWATGTAGVCAGSGAFFQPDGNLVVWSPETSCLGAINPPIAGGTVLRLHRPPIGVATLTLYNAGGETLWRAPEPSHMTCADFPPGAPDGVYTVYDRNGVGRQVYCDMSGGGWMLVGKVYLSHNGSGNISEPTDWWTAGTGQTGALVPGTVDWNGGAGYASYGATWLADLGLTKARFDLMAEDAGFFERIADAVPGETGTWYKDASTIATWFGASDTVPTAVCASEALDCEQVGRIYQTPEGTWLEGMRVPDGGGWLHTRPDSDNRFEFDGVCSYTFSAPGWHDDAADHWGNGLDIWVK